jgi:hypothetical protein
MWISADDVRAILLKAGFEKARSYEDREVWMRLGLPPPHQVNFRIRNEFVLERHAKEIRQILEDAGLLPPEEGA